jgi:hypothetical protein
VAHHRAGARHDRAAEWKIRKGAQRSGDARCNKDTGEESSEQPIWIADDLAAERWERRVCRCANRIGTINEECPLLVIEQACTTLIHNEASCQRTEGGENSGATLFTKLNARKQASPANCMRRLRQCALLQRCATCFKRGQSTGE